MKISEYINERLLLLILFFTVAVFSIAIYISDNNLLGNSNVRYMFAGSILFTVLFILLDFLILNSRIRIFKQFSRELRPQKFNYPLDRTYAGEVSKLSKEYDDYRNKIILNYQENLEFITGWIHDVKIPISAAKLILEKDTENDKSLLEIQLLSIEQQTQKILYYIKSASFYDNFKTTRLNIDAIISEHLKPFSVFFIYNKVSLDYEKSGEFVYTDEKWCGYIISQLLYNAIKHIDTGGKITIKTVKNNNHIILSITNTGIGIKDSDLQNIFEKGYTSYGSNSKSTGYGLYLVKKMCERMGHKIVAHSKYGEYAKFTITFNLTKM